MTQKRKYHFLNLGLLISLVFTLLLPKVLAEGANSEFAKVYAADTVAGFGTTLTTSKLSTFSQGEFVVEKPDSNLVKISFKTDKTGVAKSYLADYHTQLAGVYKVAINLNNVQTSGPVSTFNVLPGKVSEEKSSVTADTSLVNADGVDKALLVAKLADDYGNPFESHALSMISSRDNDLINSENNLTDQNGEITFEVSSTNSGSAIFSAIDSTSGTVLKQRPKVVFMDGENFIADAGGDDLVAQIIPIAKADFGSINNFEISDIPVNVQPNQNAGFKITSRDQNNQTVQNYTGTVHFSAEGANSGNVTLPEDYTFKAEDLGVHQFGLGLKFTQSGTYKIVVTALNNQLIKGEKTLLVGANGQQQQNGSKPIIKSPVSGTYSQNVQTITGSSAAAATINIFDNGQNIGSIQANGSGNFSFQTEKLGDGSHKIYVVTLDSDNAVSATSDTVEVVIDTTAPTVDDVQINPTSGIKPKSVINIKVMSEENLQQAAVVFNSDIVQLTPGLDQADLYAGSLQAPENPGVYKLDILLIDQLGNQATYKEKASITVSNEGGDVVTQESSQQTQQNTQTQQDGSQETQLSTQQTNLAPSQVFGVIAYGSNDRVTLVWEAASDDKMVKHYRIYYGLDANKLDNAVDTKDSSTTWYVPNLANGKEYFFQVVAIDEEGVESVNKSDSVNAIPFSLELASNDVSTKLTPQQLAALNAGTGDLHGVSAEGLDLEPDYYQNANAPFKGEPGPEMLWLVAGSGLVTGIFRKFKKK